MSKSYFMIGCDEEGIFIKELPEDLLIEKLNNKDFGNIKFLNQLPGEAGFYINQNHWPMSSPTENFILIIEGHVTIPKPKEVVTRYSLDG